MTCRSGMKKDGKRENWIINNPLDTVIGLLEHCLTNVEDAIESYLNEP